MLEITEKAAREFKKILSESEPKGSAIRVYIADQGCCGPTLAFDIVEKGETNDKEIQKDDLIIFVESTTSEKLSMVTIDFSIIDGFSIIGVSRSNCCS